MNVGPVHFISYASDYYYFLEFGTEQIYRQYAWLEKDLEVRIETQEKRSWRNRGREKVGAWRCRGGGGSSR